MALKTFDLDPPASNPYTRLAVAVLENAYRDGKRGRLDAILWLASDDCQPICDLAGLDPRQALALGARLFAGERPAKRRNGK